LKIVDKVAADIAKIKMINIRCFESDVIKMISVFFSRSDFEVIFQKKEEIIKGVERDDAFDQKIVSKKYRVSV
jgi:hypothetical protein